MIDTYQITHSHNHTPFHEKWSRALLVDLATEWQGVLKLSDWDVEVAILSQRDIGDNFGVLARLVPQKQYALVELLDPADYSADPDLIEPYDPEVTIVHELLHIYTSRMFRNPLRRPLDLDIVAEQLAHHLSHALVNLKRRLLAVGVNDPIEISDERIDQLNAIVTAAS